MDKKPEIIKKMLHRHSNYTKVVDNFEEILDSIVETEITSMFGINYTIVKMRTKVDSEEQHESVYVSMPVGMYVFNNLIYVWNYIDKGLVDSILEENVNAYIKAKNEIGKKNRVRNRKEK